MREDMGALSGSREPSPDGLGPSGFDPARMNAAWLVNMLCDYGGGYTVGRFCDSKTFRARYPEVVADREAGKRRGDSPAEAMVATLITFAEAIASEARRAETVEQGSVHEGAGRNGIAQPQPPSRTNP